MIFYYQTNASKGWVDFVSAHESGNRASIGKITRRGMRQQFDQISTVVFVQLLIRAAVIVPLALSESMGGRLPDVLALLTGAAVYVFLLIPLRFWARQKIRRVYYRHSQKSKRQSNAYSRWLSTGLLRYFRGLLWGLPFIACVVYFTVFRTILDATTFEMPIHWLAMLLAGNPENGTGNVNLATWLIAALVALFGLLFAYGWWRDLPFEYLPVKSIGPTKTVHWSRRILKKHRREMLGNTCVNFMLSLPAILGFGAVIGLYVLDKVNFSYGLTVVFTQLRRLFTEPVPQLVLLELLAVFAVLYLPLCIYRKCRNAALMARVMRSRAHKTDLIEDMKKSEAQEKTAEEEKPTEEEKTTKEEKPETPREDADKTDA